jgi:hypothetical protein
METITTIAAVSERVPAWTSMTRSMGPLKSLPDESSQWPDIVAHGIGALDEYAGNDNDGHVRSIRPGRTPAISRTDAAPMHSRPGAEKHRLLCRRVNEIRTTPHPSPRKCIDVAVFREKDCQLNVIRRTVIDLCIRCTASADIRMRGLCAHDDCWFARRLKWFRSSM